MSRQTALPLDYPSATEGPLYYLTNRQNLVSVLTGALIGPSTIHELRFDDIQDLCPGRVPLFGAAIEPSVLELATSPEVTGSFAVLVEIDSRAVTTPLAYTLNESGEAVSRRLRLGSSPGYCWAPSGLIPITAVRAIHFQTPDHLTEHEARPYGNAGGRDIRLVVSPELFAGKSPPRELVEVWLSGLAQTDFDTHQFRFLDKLSGGICCAAAMLTPDQADFDSLFKLLDGLLTGTLWKGKDPIKSAAENVARILLSGREREKPDWKSEHILLEATMRCFIDGIESASSPIQSLATIGQLVEESKTPGDLRSIEAQLEGIGKVLRYETVFRGFHTDRRGLLTGRALLLAMMRPRVEELIDWPLDETGASSSDMILAAFMTGLLRGRRRLPIDYRPEPLERLIAGSIPGLMYGGGKSKDAVLPSADQPELSLEFRTQFGIQVWSIAAAGETVLSREPEPPSLLDLFSPGILGTDTGREVALHLAETQGWDDCVVSVATGRRTTPGTVLKLDQNGHFVVVFDGFAEIKFELDIGKFMDRLEKVPVGDDVADQIRAQLSERWAHFSDDGTPDKIEETGEAHRHPSDM